MPRAVVFGCEGARLSTREKAFFREADPLGFILFARNIETPDQVRGLCRDMREAVGRDCFIMIDQEGGRVARLRGPHWLEWPNVLEAMALNPSLEAMELRFKIIALELRDVGIDVNCMPILDVARDETHPFLKSRCFGFDVETVVGAGRACVRGLEAMGVLPVIKHIPGHGLGQVDSHKGVPVVDASLADLRAVDFKPFQAFKDQVMGMSSHVVYRSIDDVVGTFSEPVISMMRQEIGFDGLLFTDDLSMGALDGDHASRSVRALKAGCDVILHCSGNAAHMEQIVAVTPLLGADGERRANIVLERRNSLPQPQDIVDIGQLVADYTTMMETDS